MSRMLVLGVRIYRHIPPPSEAGVTVGDLADALGLHPRSVQRALAAFEGAGMARREVGRWSQEGQEPTRWWRSAGLAPPESGQRLRSDESAATGQPGALARVGG